MLDAAHDVIDPVVAPSANWSADCEEGSPETTRRSKSAAATSAGGWTWLRRREVGTRTEIACSTGSGEDAGIKPRLA